MGIAFCVNRWDFVSSGMDNEISFDAKTMDTDNGWNNTHYIVPLHGLYYLSLAFNRCKLNTNPQPNEVTVFIKRNDMKATIGIPSGDSSCSGFGQINIVLEFTQGDKISVIACSDNNGRFKLKNVQFTGFYIGEIGNIENKA